MRKVILAFVGIATFWAVLAVVLSLRFDFGLAFGLVTVVVPILAVGIVFARDAVFDVAGALLDEVSFARARVDDHAPGADLGVAAWLLALLVSTLVLLGFRADRDAHALTSNFSWALPLSVVELLLAGWLKPIGLPSRLMSHLFYEEAHYSRRYGDSGEDHHIAEISRRAAQISLPARLANPLISRRNVARNIDVYRKHGVRLDAVWPLLMGAVPRHLRHGDLLSDLRLRAVRIALVAVVTSVVVGVATAQVQQDAFLLAGLYAIVVVVLARALVVGLAEAYERREAVFELYRFDLAEAMRLPIPEYQGQFAQMVGRYMNGSADMGRPIAQPEAGVAGRIDQFVEANLNRLEGELPDLVRSSLRDASDSLVSTQEAFLRSFPVAEVGSDRIAELAERIAADASPALESQMQSGVSSIVGQLSQRLQDVVTTSLTGRPIEAFSGWLIAEVSGSAVDSAVARSRLALTSESPVRVRVVLVASSSAREPGTLAAERDTVLLLERLVIDGAPRPVVSFELKISCRTLDVTPRAASVPIRPSSGERAEGTFEIAAAGRPGPHEIFIELRQPGHLIQVFRLEATVD